MQSMASACYADDQARSSEGETSSEGTGGTCSTGLVFAVVKLHPLAVAFPLDRRSSLDNHPTVPRAYLCEAVSTWRSGFRCVFFFFSRLGRQADCKLWWNRPGARGAGVVEQGSGGAFRDGAARSQRLVGTLLLTNRAARACPVKGMVYVLGVLDLLNRAVCLTARWVTLRASLENGRRWAGTCLLYTSPSPRD